MNYNKGLPSFFMSSSRYSVPPPSFLQNYPPPPLISSPQTNSFQPNLIPTAAPNSPATPTTPGSFFTTPFPVYSFFPGKNVPQGSPMDTSPTGETFPLSSSTGEFSAFQQHMMQHSPSPLITPSQSPFIIQPISRGNPQFGDRLDTEIQTDLSLNFRDGLVVSGQIPAAWTPSIDNLG